MDWLAQEGSNPNTRDHTGRTPLHLAVMSSTPDIVRALVDAGARLVSRLADGRTALHLAAARGDVEIVRILLDRSTANEAEYEEKQDRRRQRDKTATKIKDGEPASGETASDGDNDESDGELVDDDESDNGAQSIATGSFVKVGKKEAEPLDDVLPEDDDDEPDFYDINVLAWDTPCSALHYAIIEGHTEVVITLVQVSNLFASHE
jgi:ankyrin repeat protein